MTVVYLPCALTVGHIAALHVMADRHRLAVYGNGAIQRGGDLTSLVFAVQRGDDLLSNVHRGDQQRHRVGAVTARVGQAPVQRCAGHGQHVLIQGAVALAVQLGKLGAVVGFVDVVFHLRVVGGFGVDVAAAVRDFNVTACGAFVLGRAPPALLVGGGVPADSGVGVGVQCLQEVDSGACILGVIKAVGAVLDDLGRFKAAVLQLRVVAHLGLGPLGDAARCDLHAVVVAVGIAAGGVILAGQQGIERSIQRLGTGGGQVPAVPADSLGGDLGPTAVRPGLAAVPGVLHTVHRGAFAVDNGYQLTGRFDMISDLHTGKHGGPWCRSGGHFWRGRRVRDRRRRWGWGWRGGGFLIAGRRRRGGSLAGGGYLCTQRARQRRVLGKSGIGGPGRKAKGHQPCQQTFVHGGSSPVWSGQQVGQAARFQGRVYRRPPGKNVIRRFTQKKTARTVFRSTGCCILPFIRSSPVSGRRRARRRGRWRRAGSSSRPFSRSRSRRRWSKCPHRR